MSNKQDRPCTCMFFFADGRRCQMPPDIDDMGLCYFHAKRYRDHLTAQEAGRQIAQFLNAEVLTATDLNTAISLLFSAGSQGFLKPKAIASLTYLGNLLVQTQRLAKQEYIESFGGGWSKHVKDSLTFNIADLEPEPQPAASPMATDDEPDTDSPSPDDPPKIM